jgi:hypothetical protein
MSNATTSQTAKSRLIRIDIGMANIAKAEAEANGQE